LVTNSYYLTKNVTYGNLYINTLPKDVSNCIRLLILFCKGVLNVRKWIKKQRITMKLTQNDVAQQTYISRSYYTQIELGKKLPTPIIAKRIANTLDFDRTRFYQ